MTQLGFGLGILAALEIRQAEIRVAERVIRARSRPGIRGTSSQRNPEQHCCDEGKRQTQSIEGCLEPSDEHGEQEDYDSLDTPLALREERPRSLPTRLGECREDRGRSENGQQTDHDLVKGEGEEEDKILAIGTNNHFAKKRNTVGG